jgi:hypothetical protein
LDRRRSLRAGRRRERERNGKESWTGAVDVNPRGWAKAAATLFLAATLLYTLDAMLTMVGTFAYLENWSANAPAVMGAWDWATNPPIALLYWVLAPAWFVAGLALLPFALSDTPGETTRGAGSVLLGLDLGIAAALVFLSWVRNPSAPIAEPPPQLAAIGAAGTLLFAYGLFRGRLLHPIVAILYALPVAIVPFHVLFGYPFGVLQAPADSLISIVSTIAFLEVPIALWFEPVPPAARPRPLEALADGGVR